MTVSEISSCFGDEKFFPPGFRFHPTDEELVLYYLKRKICRRRLKLDIIGETDVYKWDPEDLPGLSKLKTGDRQWFFFSPRDRKYPNGSRSNRATMHGYWKATGKDRIVTCNSRSVGVKKTLVFYNGRAPSGLRTNWVMHEYTLDEEELKRCQSAQDYYVLYKVYKKSGPGPKNGEQYGAPFKEEDWVDDACSDLNGLVDQENSVKEVYGNGIISIDNTEANDQFPLNDIEELMNNIVDEPIPVSPLAVNCADVLNQLVGEQETQSTLVDYTSRQVNLQLYEAPEVTSAPNIHGEPHVAEEEFFEDFLEMDDLIGPEPTVENFVKPVENLPFGEMDGLSELDVYHDAAMFLREMGAGEVTQISQPCMNNIEDETLNYQMDETLNYQMELYSNDANEISCQLWTHDESCSVFTPVEANLEAIPSPTSGVVYDSNSANFPTGANQYQNQNQCGEEDDGTDSWFSSALWAFVESIPTTPASASESAIVNRAFERMSSFSRVKINTQNTNDAADNPAATPRRLDRSTSRAVFCFSILVVVCAILWVLIGTSTRVLWRCISS